MSIQTAHDGYWKKLGDDLTLFKIKVEAERGNIYTSDGRILATTIPTFELRMDTRADGLTDTLWNRHIDTLSYFLARYIPSQSAEGWKNYLSQARSQGKRHLLLAKDIDFLLYKKIREIPLFQKGSNKSGFITLQSNTRKNPFGQLAKRTIGYVSDYSDVKVGLEDQFDEELKGENREILMQKVAGGIYMPVNENSELGSKPGLDIYTTIDINLQDIAEKSLYEQLVHYDADHGSVILMNVKTGEIKAIANIGKTKNGGYAEILNYGVHELTEPGSVMKLASVIALVDKGYCDENTRIDLEGGQKKYANLTLKDDHWFKDDVTLAEALKYSSNVGISKMVVRYFKDNRDQFVEVLDKLHLTQSYNLGLKGESTPILRPTKEWSGVTLPWLSIGYEIRVTPLQILGLYAAVANNGKLMQPYLIKSIKENDRVIEEYNPKVLEQEICKPTTIAAVRKMLESVVEDGTASNIRNENYTIAGKTGTNLLPDKVYGFKRKHYQASFAGYFPANNPSYACIVVINKPNTSRGYYGREVAAPVFKNIADRIYSTDINIHPSITQVKEENFAMKSFVGVKKELEKIADYLDWKTISSDEKSDWVQTMSSQNKMVFKPTHFTNERVMPNVSNMNAKDAIYLLETMGLRVYVEGIGKVRTQSIRPGTYVPKGTYVKINLS